MKRVGTKIYFILGQRFGSIQLSAFISERFCYQCKIFSSVKEKQVGLLCTGHTHTKTKFRWNNMNWYAIECIDNDML